jgi:hypothetical protein
MSPDLLTLVTKQHHEELRWWARCCAHWETTPLAPKWPARLQRALILHLRPAPASRRCCA